MDGNMAKLIITIATLKNENERLQKIINSKGDSNENKDSSIEHPGKHPDGNSKI